MKSTLIQAAVVSALAAGAGNAATFPGAPNSLIAEVTVSDGEGAGGGRGVRVAGPLPSVLFAPSQSPLVAVGEGGEGGEGRRGRGIRKFRERYDSPPRYYYGDPYYNGDRPYDNRRYEPNYYPRSDDPYYDRRRSRPY